MGRVSSRVSTLGECLGASGSEVGSLLGAEAWEAVVAVGATWVVEDYTAGAAGRRPRAADRR